MMISDEPHTAEEVDAMLLRQFQNDLATGRLRNLRAEMLRLSTRAVDKVLAEFRARGFAGFRVCEVDGQLFVEGLTLAEIGQPVPDFLTRGSHE